jgi:hypothetical protein
MLKKSKKGMQVSEKEHEKTAVAAIQKSTTSA